MKCRNCKHLDKGWCAHKIDSPDPELERECKDYMQATNADRIRDMSDEELCVFLDEFSANCCSCRDNEGKNEECPINRVDPERFCSPSSIMAWLQSSTKGGGLIWNG